MSEQPALSGQFEAWVRQGAKDLHNAIVPAFPESARGVEEIGTPLAPTQAMVTQDLEVGSYENDLSHYAARAEPQQEAERGMER
jgi:hypothetical protein